METNYEKPTTWPQKARHARQRIGALAASAILVISQALGLVGACAPEPAMAEQPGSVVQIEPIYLNDELGQSIFCASPGGPRVFCIEGCVKGQEGRAVAEELLGSSTRYDAGGYIARHTWTQDAITEAALIQEYVNTHWPTEQADNLNQRYLWAYTRGDFSLDYVVTDKMSVDGRGDPAATVAWVRENKAAFIGHGMLYRRDNEKQSSARLWLEHALGDLEIQKASGDESVTAGNNVYSLAGAEFGVYSDEGCSTLATTMVTNDEGGAKATGLAAGVYWVRETKPPQGFALDKTVHRIEVPAGDVARFRIEDTPQTCPVAVAVQKLDAETGEGGQNLAGAKFRLDYYAGNYGLDDLPDNPASSFTLTTGEDGKAILNESLPLGTVVVTETLAPEGYVLNSIPALVHIAPDGDQVEVHTYQAPSIADKRIRGDLYFVKADEDTQRRMANVAFLLTSEKTGERHVLVTDENGCFDSSDVPHTQRTNASDAALADDGKTVDTSKLDPSAGVWFGGTSPDDSQGALPFGTYALQELRCEANSGHRLVSTALRVSRDGKRYELGTFDNKQPALTTTLYYSGGEKICPAVSEVELTDAVGYENLERGRAYRREGELHAVNRDGEDTGVVASANHSFTPTLSCGLQKVSFSLSTAGLEGMRLVAFERLYDGDDLLAEHADVNDEGQSVRVPRISTELTGDAGHTVDIATGMVKLTDTVEYSNLEPGRAYELQGTLHVRGENGEEAGAALDEQGAEIRARAEFTPEGTDGTAEVVFEFTAPNLAGSTVVAFESLCRNGETYAVHADIADESQAVTFAPPPEQTPPAQPREPGIPQTGEVPLPVFTCVVLGGLLAFCAWAIVHARSMKAEDVQ